MALNHSLHIYTVPGQKATQYRVEFGDTDITITNKPHSKLVAWCCGEIRLAKNLRVQAYYDGPRFWCIKGKGCKKK